MCYFYWYWLIIIYLKKKHFDMMALKYETNSKNYLTLMAWLELLLLPTLEKKEIEMVAIINLLELLPLLSMSRGQRCRGCCWSWRKKKNLAEKRERSLWWLLLLLAWKWGNKGARPPMITLLVRWWWLKKPKLWRWRRKKNDNDRKGVKLRVKVGFFSNCGLWFPLPQTMESTPTYKGGKRIFFQ